MVSAQLRKSITDLTRRRARTAFAVATLALAVASISFFAVPTLIDQTMQQEVRTGQLADLSVGMRPMPLTAAQLASLEALPNVAAVEPRNSVDARVLVGERRAQARVIGVRNFARQRVDVVRVESGATPGPGEVLADVQDANVGVYDGDAGDTLTVVGRARRAGSPERVELAVTGRGRSFDGGEQVQDNDLIVLYAPSSTVERLSGERGYDRLALRLRDTSPAAAAQTVGVLRGRLETIPGFNGFENLPDVRAPGDWPGKADTQDFAKILGVITALALLSAVVLVSNTMTTLVAEQTGEIGIMRAIGARRRQVALVYVKTAVLLGMLGAAVGIGLGILIAYALARYFGSMFWAVDVGFGVDTTVLAVSAFVGVLAPPLAALPAIRRAVRVDLREALESTGSAVGGLDAGDRFLRRIAFLPRTMQIGLRDVGRRRRRSFATALIVALAVGNLLAFLGLSAAATQSTRTAWGEHLEDIRLWTSGRDLFDARAVQTIRSTPGVAEAQPALVNDVRLAGKEAFVWGVPREPLIDYRMTDGRWFSAGEEQRREPVAVIERNLAQATGVEVGERVTLATADGRASFRIVGIAKNQQEDGTVLFVPLTTLRSILHEPTGVDTFWIRTTSRDHALIDRTASRLEDRLAALGYETGGEITYVGERDEIASNRTLTNTIAVLGFLIVAMSMVALANAITMSIIERTREIGILRCIGARARDIRRIFTTEGLALALAGWVVGIPVGYLLNRLLVRLIWEVVDVRVPVVFPPWNLVLALVGTIALALLVILLPLRRAVRTRPGQALRYA
ncbi:MAG TPA: FtsX-like permease family protein [Gaiellaceae bacterium]|nr:FtsX-like permease family protein [Gaiellaceae bacterium]